MCCSLVTAVCCKLFDSKALDQYAIFSATLLLQLHSTRSFLDAHLVTDEVTPYRRQYYLLHDIYELNWDKINIKEGVEVQVQQQSAPKIE